MLVYFQHSSENGSNNYPHVSVVPTKMMLLFKKCHAEIRRFKKINYYVNCISLVCWTISSVYIYLATLHFPNMVGGIFHIMYPFSAYV